MSGRTSIRPLAVSMGDPAGIGPEIIAKAWKARELHSLAPFFVIGNPKAIAAVWDGPISIIGSPHDAASRFAETLPVLPVGEAHEVVPGFSSGDGAQVALQALEIGVGLARSAAAGALVTGPVSKAQLYQVGFTHPGQTEFVAERCGISADSAVMMLAGPTLRVVPMTVHVALAQVPGMISQELILSKARVTARGLLRNFGIERPRLAFAGLNPHAGESGAIGREEVDILTPALAQLRTEGVDAVGPFSADTMFHPRARAGYDAALCLYHDQALIPIKTLHFDDGVNITLGLPIVRTSPDHGTAFNIAGSNQADPGAMIAALRMAQSAAERRSATSAIGLP
ncbi:4-hydroxythreonine-4-phosphate dehydrogenase PdxA [Sphingomonas xinjiangensis]